MSDMREKQPPHKTMDFTYDTRGAYKWVCQIVVWPYSGMKNDDCYSRNVRVELNAESCISALRFAECIKHTIEQGHDIWQVNVVSVVQQ